MAAPENPVTLPQAISHQLSIARNVFPLEAVDYCLIGSVGKRTQPRLPKDIHFAVVDIRPEGWVSKNEVD